jgi:hypothetical protein
MSNYTQNVFFGPKDALSTGDPNKKIKGTEFDAELAEISTAIATKEETANKGATNGYAGLGSDGLVPNAQLPDASETVQGVVELATTAEAMVGTDTTRAVTPAGLEAWAGQNTGMVQDLTNLSDPNVDAILFWDDSLGAATFLTMGTNISISGNVLNVATMGTDAAALTTGVLANARVQQSNVTQHQAALSIAETQIADGSIYTRNGGTETVTGPWTFTHGSCNFSGGVSTLGIEVGFRVIPAVVTAGGTPLTDARGKILHATGGITVAAGTFVAGDTYMVYNNTAGGLNLFQGAGLTLRWAGSASTGGRIIAQRGLAFVHFISASEAVCSGDLS